MANKDVKEYGFAGNLTLTSATEINDMLKKVIEERADIAIVSMEKVERVDSSGLGGIFRFQGELKRQEIKFALIHVGSQPRHLFNFSMLDKLVPIFADKDEAIAALQKN